MRQPLARPIESRFPETPTGFDLAGFRRPVVPATEGRKSEKSTGVERHGFPYFVNYSSHFLDAFRSVIHSSHGDRCSPDREFVKWLIKLKDRTARMRIADRLERVALGNLGDCKALGEGLFEFRIAHGPGYRLYFSRHGDTIVVLPAGGDKSLQTRDIGRAREILKGLDQ